MAASDPTHPSAEELRSFSQGRASDDEVARIAAHLDECQVCRRRVDEFSTQNAFLGRLQAATQPGGKLSDDAAQRRSAVRALQREQHREDAAFEAGPADASGQDQPDGLEGRACSDSPFVLSPEIVCDSASAGDSPACPAGLATPGSEDSAACMPRQVGAYDLLQEVGRGGMGVVYAAWHRELRRPVALKMVLAGDFASPSQRLRFQLEAELAARVQHSNIIQIYEVGTHQSQPFLAMEWVDGGSLADQLDGSPWPGQQAAQVMETLALALQAIHEHGIVHRDLKPANILLQKEEGRGLKNDNTPCPSSDPSFLLCPFSFIPKISDFGLAQSVEGSRSLTRSGFLVGTPGYMAPEQASGQRALVGPATDIYALGVLLYQLLTGQLPFQGDSALEVLRAVTEDQPVRPRRLQPGIPRDLEAITLHCLEKEPGRRYPTALALAEDLQRFREGKPVVARPMSAAARLVRWCRRNPLVTLLLAFLMASLFEVTWKWLEADEQRDRANANARKADAGRQAALRQSYQARIAAATAALQSHEVAEAARQLQEAPAGLRAWEWRHLHSRLDESSALLRASTQSGFGLLSSADGLRLWSVTSTDLRLTDEDGRECLALPRRLFHTIYAVAPARGGLSIADGDENQTLRLLDKTGNVQLSADGEGKNGAELLAVDFNQKRLAVAWRDGDQSPSHFELYGSASRKPYASCVGHTGPVMALAFSPDGTQIASASEDGTARVWNAATGALTSVLRGHAVKIYSVAFRPDGARVLTAAADGAVCQWDARTGRLVETPYKRHTGEVRTAVYRPDGQWIASAGTDRTIRLWQATGNHETVILHGHTGLVVKLAFHPDGRRLASASEDGTIRIWAVDPPAILPVLQGHTSYIYPVAYSPDGQWIASGSWDRSVRLWDARTGDFYAKLPHTGFVRTLAFSPDNSWLVTGCDQDERLHIWDVATARLQKTIPGPGKILQAVAVSPDGTRIAAVARNGALSIREAATGQAIASLHMSGSHTRKGLDYSPDGRWLAGTGMDRKISVWDTQTNQLAATLAGHTGDIYSVAFSPDGRRLVSASGDQTVRVWSVDRGECLAVLAGHTAEVFTAVFHPDATRIASAGRDQAICLWDMATAEEERIAIRLQGHTNYVFSLAFSPDGKTLVSGSGDGTVRLWDTEPLARRYQGRREIEAVRPQAQRLVERLFADLPNLAQVAARLQDDKSLGDPLRRAALQAVMRWGERARP